MNTNDLSQFSCLYLHYLPLTFISSFWSVSSNPHYLFHISPELSLFIANVDFNSVVASFVHHSFQSFISFITFCWLSISACTLYLSCHTLWVHVYRTYVAFWTRFKMWVVSWSFLLDPAVDHSDTFSLNMMLFPLPCSDICFHKIHVDFFSFFDSPFHK